MIARYFYAAAVSAALALAGVVAPAAAEEKSDFKVCWSIYVGWMPWGYIQDSGIMKKWADKYGISVEIVQINDYVESINQYTAGEYDGCSMTNMDALSIPAGGGVDITALIIGDFSNGNDAILLKNDDTLEAIKGQNVNLVELSVSHYLLARGLDSVELAEKDITVVNTSDADMIAAYETPDVTAVVTWNPLVSTILEGGNATKVFDSSQIPGEIIDIMMVAEASGTDLAGYDEQLATTQMFFAPGEAVEFANDARIVETMRFVAEFLFDHGILGTGAASPEDVGIAFTQDRVFGNTDNIKLRFDPAFMAMAAEGDL